MQGFEVGDKIEYCLFDKDAKQHWFKGVIHAVRRYEDAATNMIIRQTYLVDTGRDERVDEIVFDHRGREMDKRVRALYKPGPDHKKNTAKLDAIVEEVSQHSDLPDAKIGKEYLRQPEQLELPAERIRTRL